jgi:O-antigen/teichoic acid export membrane protein
MIWRGTHICIAYGITLLAVLGCFLLLRQGVTAQSLQAVLGYYLIATITGGIEPGTSKAHILLGNSQRQDISHSGLFGATAAKSLIAFPFFAGIWLFASADAPSALQIILCSWPLAFIGFLTTNYRNLLDIEGRFAAAIWLKQGSLCLTITVASLVILAGGSLLGGIIFGTFVRIAWLGLFLCGARGSIARRAGRAAPVAETLRLLRMQGWTSLAAISVLGSLGGSIDRLVALRFLNAEQASIYLVGYELLSKFWILPYILAPIVFASRARGDGGRSVRRAMLLIAGAGVPFVISTPIGLAILHLQWPNHLEGLSPLVGGLLAFAFTVSAATQVLVADLQAKSRTRGFAVASLPILILSIGLFGVLTLHYGVVGVALAWLLRTGVELSVVLALTMYSGKKVLKERNALQASP